MSLKKCVSAAMLSLMCLTSASAAQLVGGVKITGVTIGYMGGNGFIAFFDAAGPGTGVCKSTGWVSFEARNWPYATNTAAVDTAQFDRLFASVMTAMATGLRITVDGGTACNSGNTVSYNP